MNDYTRKQIEEARDILDSWVKDCPHIVHSVINKNRDWDIGLAVDTILAALESAEKERDEWQESARTANTALLKVCKERDALAAYAAKLEKAGDGMRVLLPFASGSAAAWDAARREKP